MAAAAVVQHASTTVFPAAVVSAFCGRWRKESRPGSVSQDLKEKKKEKSNRFVARTLWQKGNGDRKKGGAIIICLFPLLLQWYMPRGVKEKSHFDI